jgi:EAL domain-containing protein (putative c-di-GMP-specific phosphodiesterase class I)
MTFHPADLGRAVVAAVEGPGMVRTHFQPIADVARGVVTGYEALARFNGPPDLSPDRWFAAAYAHGVGERLEARALSTALAARDALPPNAFLTVNVGPAALLSEPVADVLAGEGDLRGVVIEITEQQPIDDYDAVSAALAPLREAGAMLAVDDAGAGFSSLMHITTLRPDLVKVDRGLVAGIDTDPTRAAVIETLGIFASRLDAWLLAEGVETAGELERLLALGVPLAQGWLLGRPAPAMTGIAAEAAAICRHRAELADRSELLGMTEVAPRVSSPASDGELAEAFLRHPGCSWAAIVDEFDRPVALVARGGGLRTRRRVPALCVMAGDRVPDIARRMVTRDAGDRFTPLAMCDEIGRLCGLIPVERIMERLADAVEGRRDAGVRQTA